MDYLKKNYEKILLCVVLLGLVVAVAFLPVKISSERDKMLEMQKSHATKPKPLPPLDMAREDTAMKLMAEPPLIDLSPPNRLFNPVVWQKAADGRLIKFDSTNVGPNALVMTNLTPLYLRLTLDSITLQDSGPRYAIGAERQAAANPKDRAKKQTYCSIGTKADLYTLRDVKVTPDNQTNVVLELHDTGQSVTVSKEKPYERVDGYTVDLKYPPENITFPPARRVGATLEFNNESYKIVSITTNEIVLWETSNSKKWTLSHTTAPTP